MNRCSWCSHPDHTGACKENIQTGRKLVWVPCPCAKRAVDEELYNPGRVWENGSSGPEVLVTPRGPNPSSSRRKGSTSW